MRLNYTKSSQKILAHQFYQNTPRITKPQKGAKTMNPEQLAKMQAARQSPKTTSTSFPLEGLTVSQRNDLQTVHKYLPTAFKTFYKAYHIGNRASAVKAKCIECCNLDKHQVAICNISGCPLWLYRPFRQKA
jgi:hypothetical protein